MKGKLKCKAWITNQCNPLIRLIGDSDDEGMLPRLESRILRIMGLRRIKIGRYYEGKIKMQRLNHKSVQSNNPFNRWFKRCRDAAKVGITDYADCGITLNKNRPLLWMGKLKCKAWITNQCNPIIRLIGDSNDEGMLPMLESRIMRIMGLRRIKTGNYYEGEN